MKIVLLCLATVAAMASARPETTYTNKYDSVDLNEILQNRRLLIPYLKCILDQGRCAPEGKELKSHIREALESYCAKCTDAQRRATRTVIGHLINKENDYWAKLTAKYDPGHKYVAKYEQELRIIKA